MKIYLRLQDVVQWFGMTSLELLFHVFSVLTFSVLAALKQENVISWSWKPIFIPIIVADALQFYICLIIAIRQCKNHEYKKAGIRFISSSCITVCVCTFKLLLMTKFEEPKSHSYSQVFAPLFVLAQVLMVKVCHTSAT